MKLSLLTKNESETISLGQKIGANLRGGEIIVLNSDLGGGKTTLAKGIAQGINSNDEVSSPTFTLSQIYKGTKLTIHHFDFYRLSDIGLLGEELDELTEDESVVLIVEWPRNAEVHFDKEKVVDITIERQKSSEYDRSITLGFSETNSYIIKNMNGQDL